MKKFMFLYYGEWETSSQEMKDAWGKWFADNADKMVDSGNPFGPGKEITPNGTRDLSNDSPPMTGYSMINAASLDEAQQIAETCPVISSVRVYEAMSM
jgi:hypothetical protein